MTAVGKSQIPYRVFVQIVFVLFAITIIFALYYLVANSIKTAAEINVSQFTPPKSLNFSNIKYVWKKADIGVSFRNSLIICTSGCLISVCISLITGFAFTFLRFRGKRLLSYLIVSTMYISPMALVVPLYLQMRQLHLTNTFAGIIIIYLGITLAFAIYLMTTYLKAIPEEIIEAAVIDGCGNTGILLRIILPLMKPGIMVVGVINFSVMWNDLLFAFIFLQKVEKQTMMIAITSFRGAMGGGNMAYIMSSLLIATIPIMVIYLFTQKFFKEGMSMGAIK